MFFGQWDKYREWNNLLAKYFFNKDTAFREVLLFSDQQLINELGRDIGQSFEDFIESVKTGPYWITRQGICQKALQAYKDWRGRGLEYPPYISYLVLFVIASITEGDFSSTAYYRPFRKLLGEEETGRYYPSFDKMHLLWEDLETWSKIDKKEELGRFTTRVRGMWAHVGIPRSQVVLSMEERRQLPLVFLEAELDPADRPSTEGIRQALLAHGQDHLMRKTMVLLQGREEDEVLKEALLNFVLDELSEWDGTAKAEVKDGITATSQIFSGLRICIKLNRAAEKVSTTVRICTSHAYPEYGLSLKNTDGSLIWGCYEYRNGWSKELIDEKLNMVADTGLINWSRGLKLVDQENSWSARLKASNLRVFLLGKRFGIPDWVEVNHLERNCNFLLACEGQITNDIITWGQEKCDNFIELKYQGLPEGWRIFEGKNALYSFKGDSALTLSEYLRLSFEGGIKVKGITYLNFAPPSIALENYSGKEKVTLNGQEITQEENDIPHWPIPVETASDTQSIIEVSDGDGQCIIRKTIKLVDPSIASDLDHTPRRNCIGEVSVLKDDEPYAVGAIVEKDLTTADAYPYSFPTFLSNRILFLGARPGEIIDWPKDPIDVGWRPVWAIFKINRKIWQTIFCGNEEQIMPKQAVGEPVTDKVAVRYWARTLWTMRKTIVKPQIKSLQSAWAMYMGVAKNAR